MKNKKHPNRIGKRRQASAQKSQKPTLNHFESTHPEHSFFVQNPTQETISNVKRRLYGITYSTRQQRNICKHYSQQISIKHEKLSELIHKTQCLANQLAYNAHNGKHWQRDDISKMQQGLFNQLEGGRAMEILLAEAMMRHSDLGYHFLPVKELDLHYKTDLMSRIPYYEGEKLKTINFGMQITLADILEENDNNPHKKSKTRYQEKYDQVENIVPFLESQQTSKEITQKYGRIYNSDIMSYTGINGIIKQKITNSQPTAQFFKKWRKNNFEEEGLLDFFDNDFRQAIAVVAQSINKAQKYISSKKFLLDAIKNYHTKKNKGFQKIHKIDNNFTSRLKYKPQENVLIVATYYQNNILSKTTFFLTDTAMKHLFDMHNPEDNT